MTDSHTSCIIFILLLNKINAFRSFSMVDMETVLAVENEIVTFVCTKNMPMSYCGFIHPNGSRYSFTGPEVNAGRCELKIKVTSLDIGLWKCHIGQKTPGIEIAQVKSVRVTDRLAAVSQNISSVHGKDVTLYCTTAENMLPLKYCRFEPPSENPFSIGPDATVENPILSRYYYPENKSLDRGDCAVTIHKVKYSDMGDWTCGAGFDDDGMEYTDIISLKVEGIYTISPEATTAGLSVAVVMAIIVLIVLTIVIWKRRHLFRNRVREQEIQQESIEIGEIGEIEPEIEVTPQSSRVPIVIVESPSDPESPI